MLNSLLAGLVAVTAGCATVGPAVAIAIGVLAAFTYHFTNKQVLRMGIDDVVGAFSVHGTPGIVGCLAAGVFSRQDYVDAAHGVGALSYHPAKQLGVQLLFVLCIIAWSVGTSSIVLYILSRTIGIRVSTDDEIVGLDFALHSGYAYETHNKRMLRAKKQIEREQILGQKMRKHAMGANGAANGAGSGHGHHHHHHQHHQLQQLQPDGGSGAPSLLNPSRHNALFHEPGQGGNQASGYSQHTHTGHNGNGNNHNNNGNRSSGHQASLNDVPLGLHKSPTATASRGLQAHTNFNASSPPSHNAIVEMMLRVPEMAEGDDSSFSDESFLTNNSGGTGGGGASMVGGGAEDGGGGGGPRVSYVNASSSQLPSMLPRRNSAPRGTGTGTGGPCESSVQPLYAQVHAHSDLLPPANFAAAGTSPSTSSSCLELVHVLPASAPLPVPVATACLPAPGPAAAHVVLDIRHPADTIYPHQMNQSHSAPSQQQQQLQQQQQQQQQAEQPQQQPRLQPQSLPKVPGQTLGTTPDGGAPIAARDLVLVTPTRGWDTSRPSKRQQQQQPPQQPPQQQSSQQPLQAASPQNGRAGATSQSLHNSPVTPLPRTISRHVSFDASPPPLPLPLPSASASSSSSSSPSAKPPAPSVDVDMLSLRRPSLTQSQQRRASLSHGQVQAAQTQTHTRSPSSSFTQQQQQQQQQQQGAVLPPTFHPDAALPSVAALTPTVNSSMANSSSGGSGSSSSRRMSPRFVRVASVTDIDSNGGGGSSKLTSPSSSVTASPAAAPAAAAAAPTSAAVAASTGAAASPFQFRFQMNNVLTSASSASTSQGN